MADNLLEVTRQVRNRDELTKALALVHDNYVRCGYIEPRPSGIRLSIHYIVPTTRTFITVLGDEMIATISLFCDSPLGLPMDVLYGDELLSLRQQGRHIAEVGMLADGGRSLSVAFPAMMALMKRVYWACMGMARSDLLVTVNPKHRAFYRRMFCFEEYGSERTYAAINDAPVVLLRMNLSVLGEEDAQQRRVRQAVFSPFPEGPEFEGDYQMRSEDIEYFFLAKTNILQEADDKTIKVVEGWFPACELHDA